MGRASWAMACAILPSLLFLGHWSLRFDLPGTSARLVVLPGEEHSADHDSPHGQSSNDAHERHCHGDAASCSDVPFAGGSAFALLKEFAVRLPGAAESVGVAALVIALSALHCPAPERRPPRATRVVAVLVVQQVGGLR